MGRNSLLPQMLMFYYICFILFSISSYSLSETLESNCRHDAHKSQNMSMYFLKNEDIFLFKGNTVYPGQEVNIGTVSSVQSLRRVQLSATPLTVACQLPCLSPTLCLLKLTSIESVMPSNHCILCCPLLLLPSIFPSIRIFSSESVLHIRWPKYWSFSFSINPSMNIWYWFPLGWTDCISLQSKGLSRIFSSNTVQKSQFFGAQLSL